MYVRNLTQVTTEEMLKEKFDEFGKVERVKKIKDYAFVHFEERDEAVKVSELVAVTYSIFCYSLLSVSARDRFIPAVF